MNVLELIRSTKTDPAGKPPYVSLYCCHKYDCPSWRTGKKHSECNCGAKQMLNNLEKLLAKIEVPQELIRFING